MVFCARKSTNMNEFFVELNAQYEQVQKMSDKVNVTGQYLKTNSDLIEKLDSGMSAPSNVPGKSA